MDRLSDRAICRQIADELRTAIANGLWQPGDKLPSQSELAGTYGCHTDTARSAMRILATEGLVETRPRDGTVVTGDDPRMVVEVTAPVRITARPATEPERTAYGYRTGVVFLEIEHPADTDGEPLIERHPSHTTTIEVNG
jgi:DNA-binding FadR family transcriptional regulator